MENLVFDILGTIAIPLVQLAILKFVLDYIRQYFYN